MPTEVTVQSNELRLRDPAVFGPGRQRHALRFACRALALPEVRSITMEPTAGEARIGYRTATEERNDFLSRLATAISSDTDALDETLLPCWPDGEAVTLTRAGGVVTTLRILDARADRLRVTHRRLAGADDNAARRAERALRSLPGVRSVEGNGGTLTLRFDPSRIDSAGVIRAVELHLAADGAAAKTDGLPAVPFGVANTTVGLGTVGELMLPLATPVAAGILVATNLNVVRDAAAQLSRGKVGVPLFHTALLACSIATGQVLAYALTDWSLRFWQQRWRNKVSEATERLLEETAALPEQARVVEANGAETHRPVALLRPGDRIRVDAGETIPADGRVVAGEALVEEARLTGADMPLRKSLQDTVLAGSSLLTGQVEIEIRRSGNETLAASIAGNLAVAATTLSRERALLSKSEHLAQRTVLPTLATAGVGWAAGDLITVGAILHQDWISGPVLAVPLLAVNQMRTALHHGALVRSATAIPRMAESDFVVLDGDDPALAAPGLELADMQSRLSATDAVLQYAAAAGLFLGDERSSALANACRDRGLIVRQPVLSALEPGVVEVRAGGRTIRLTDGPIAESRRARELSVQIDDREVARLSFRAGARPQAADTLLRLRAAGVQTFVVSSESESRADDLARRLGADLSGGELDAAGRIRFLQGLRRRGVHPVYVGRLDGQADLAREAHVAVAVGGLTEAVTADVVLLGHSYQSLAALMELSRRYEPEILNASRMATIPNLLCIAGAFAGLLNGITAGIIANVGVMSVDRRLRRMLESSAGPSRFGIRPDSR